MTYVSRPSRPVAGSFGRMDQPRSVGELYETPASAVDALLQHTKLVLGMFNANSSTLRGPVLEPSAGKGAIAKRLRHHGHTVVAYDLHDWYGAEGVEPSIDFLAQSDTRGCKSIVMNPPFKDADAHVRHALNILPQHGTLYVLLRLTWIAAKKRADLLPHIEKIIICGRLKMLPPNTRDAGHSGTVDFAWFIFRPFRLPLGTVIVRAS